MSIAIDKIDKYLNEENAECDCSCHNIKLAEVVDNLNELLCEYSLEDDFRKKNALFSNVLCCFSSFLWLDHQKNIGIGSHRSIEGLSIINNPINKEVAMNIDNILDKAIEILKDYDSSEEMKCFVFNPESQKSIHLRFRIGEQDENLS